MLVFLSAFGLGIAFCASPGAVTAQTIRRGLERGFLAALLLQLGALVGLALWAIIALAGAALLAQHVLAQLFLGVLGILLLMQLAWRALRDAYRGRVVEATPSDVRGDLALGAVLSLANPLPIAFWLSVGGSVISTVPISPEATDVLVFFAGFISSAVLWSFFLAGLLAWGKRFVTPQLFRVVNLICGLALGFFALKLLWNVLSLYGLP